MNTRRCTHCGTIDHYDTDFCCCICGERTETLPTKPARTQEIDLEYIKTLAAKRMKKGDRTAARALRRCAAMIEQLQKFHGVA